MKTKEYRKVPLNIRVSEDILFIIDKLLPVLNLERRELIELSVLSFIETIDKDKYKIEGFDYITYGKIKKKRFLRQLQGLIRTEIISKASFLKRTEEDIFKMLIFNAPLTEVKKLIYNRKLELKNYEETEDIEKVLDKYLTIKEEDYQKMIGVLRNKIDDDKYIQTNNSPRRIRGLVNNEKKQTNK